MLLTQCCVHRGWITAACAGAMLVCLGSGAARAQNLITNGTFSAATSIWLNQSTEPGWSASGGATVYDFVYIPGMSGVSYSFQLRDQANSSNGWNGAGPTGGNFAAAMGNISPPAPLTQTVSGLSVGASYTLSFAWGVGMFTQYYGNTTGYWSVSLGSSTQNTNLGGAGSYGFSGWANQSFTYVATATSEVLSFTAEGTAGQPIVTLANVSLTQNAPVAEPTSLTVFGSGLAAVLGLARRRRMPFGAAFGVR